MLRDIEILRYVHVDYDESHGQHCQVRQPCRDRDEAAGRASVCHVHQGAGGEQRGQHYFHKSLPSSVLFILIIPGLVVFVLIVLVVNLVLRCDSGPSCGGAAEESCR